MSKDIVLISGAIVYRQTKGKKRWLLVQESEEDEWEIPKILARKAESSARAAMRLLLEQASMDTQVLEEAGRAGGSAIINGKNVPQRYLYYLMLFKDAGEALGFHKIEWFEYAQAVRKLKSKRERAMIKAAREEYKGWKKRMDKEESQ